MVPRSDELDAICRIPERLADKPMRELVVETRYRDLRPALTREELSDHLARHPELVRGWLRYSEGKRTSGGWYLMHPASGWLVGRLGGPEKERELRFGSGPEACAEFILRELDGVAGEPAGAPRPG